MTTLAQTMVDRPLALPHDNKRVEEGCKIVTDFIVSCLSQPIHSHVAANAEDFHRTAERFVFSDCCPDAVCDLVEAGELSRPEMRASMQLIANPMWVEFPEPAGKVGALLYETPIRFRNSGEVEIATKPVGLERGWKRGLMMMMCAEVEHGACCFATMFLPPMPYGKEPPQAQASTYAMAVNIEDICGIARDILDCVFVLSVPRVCDVVDAVPSKKLQRSRERAGKHPLVEIKRVRMNIGGTQHRGRQGEASGEEGAHRRYHRVIGHFRTYTAKRDMPKISFVPQHWRGDPSLGIVLHERNVVRV